MTKLGLTPAARYHRKRLDICATVNGEGVAHADGSEFEAPQTLGSPDFPDELDDGFYVFGSYTLKEYCANRIIRGSF